MLFSKILLTKNPSMNNRTSVIWKDGLTIEDIADGYVDERQYNFLDPLKGKFAYRTINGAPDYLTLCQYSYLFAQYDGPLAQNLMYGFYIDDVEYVNDGTSNVYYHLDLVNTFKDELSKCREIVERDSLEPEHQGTPDPLLRQDEADKLVDSGVKEHDQEKIIVYYVDVDHAGKQKVNVTKDNAAGSSGLKGSYLDYSGKQAFGTGNLKYKEFNRSDLSKIIFDNDLFKNGKSTIVKAELRQWDTGKSSVKALGKFAQTQLNLGKPFTKNIIKDGNGNEIEVEPHQGHDNPLAGEDKETVSFTVNDSKQINAKPVISFGNVNSSKASDFSQLSFTDSTDRTVNLYQDAQIGYFVSNYRKINTQIENFIKSQDALFDSANAKQNRALENIKTSLENANKNAEVENSKANFNNSSSMWEGVAKYSVGTKDLQGALFQGGTASIKDELDYDDVKTNESIALKAILGSGLSNNLDVYPRWLNGDASGDLRDDYSIHQANLAHVLRLTDLSGDAESGYKNLFSFLGLDMRKAIKTGYTEQNNKHNSQNRELSNIDNNYNTNKQNIGNNADVAKTKAQETWKTALTPNIENDTKYRKEKAKIQMTSKWADEFTSSIVGGIESALAKAIMGGVISLVAGLIKSLITGAIDEATIEMLAEKDQENREVNNENIYGDNGSQIKNIGHDKDNNLANAKNTYDNQRLNTEKTQKVDLHNSGSSLMNTIDNFALDSKRDYSRMAIGKYYQEERNSKNLSYAKQVNQNNADTNTSNTKNTFKGTLEAMGYNAITGAKNLVRSLNAEIDSYNEQFETLSSGDALTKLDQGRFDLYLFTYEQQDRIIDINKSLILRYGHYKKQLESLDKYFNGTYSGYLKINDFSGLGGNFGNQKLFESIKEKLEQGINIVGTTKGN